MHRRDWSPRPQAAESPCLARRVARARRPTAEGLEDRRLLAIDFVSAFGVGANGAIVANGVATNAAGEIYVVGNLTGTADFDPGPGAVNLTSAGGTDIFVAKYSAAGALLFARRFGADGSDLGTAIATDAAGSLYATGTFTGPVDFDPGAGNVTLNAPRRFDAFFLKLDTNGTFVYARSATGPNVPQGSPPTLAQGRAIAVDGTGQVAVTGTLLGVATFGTTTLTPIGSVDPFVAKLDAAGNFVFARLFAGTTNGDSESRGVAFDPAGNVVSTGRFQSTIDFNPGPAVFNLTSAGSDDIYISKLDPNGNFVFARRIGGAAFDRGNAVATDSAGDIYLTGVYSGVVDFDPGPGTINLSRPNFGLYAMRLNSGGNLVWVRDLGAGSAGPNGGNGGIALRGDDVFVTGGYQGTATPGATGLPSAGGTDILVVQLGIGGEFREARRAGGAGGDAPNGIVVNAAGAISIAGAFVGPATFGTTQLPALGGESAFVTRLTVGTPPPARSTMGDFDGDRRSDLAVFRRSEARWLSVTSGGPVVNTVFGATNLFDIPVPADFDGDGITDLAIFRPSEARWLSLLSGGGVLNTVFGAPNLFDIPVPADYNGDGRAEVAVFRPTEARWLSLLSGGGVLNTVFGATGLFDIPVPADYDGDGRADLAVFRPSEARWLSVTTGGPVVNTIFGATGFFDFPVPGDYDGDGRADLAVFRPSEARWLSVQTGGTVLNTVFGAANGFDLPTPTSIASLRALNLISGSGRLGSFGGGGSGSGLGGGGRLNAIVVPPVEAAGASTTPAFSRPRRPGPEMLDAIDLALGSALDE